MQYIDQHSRFLLVLSIWCANRDVESILQKYFPKSILKILFYFVSWKYFCKVFYFVIFKILFLHYFIFHFENTFEKYFAHHWVGSIRVGSIRVESIRVNQIRIDQIRIDQGSIRPIYVVQRLPNADAYGTPTGFVVVRTSKCWIAMTWITWLHPDSRLATYHWITDV